MIFFVLYMSSPLFAMLAPGWILGSHLRAQSRLLAYCVTLYLAAIEAWDGADERTAREHLARIRRVEARWRFGQSMFYQVARGVYAIGVAFFGHLALVNCLSGLCRVVLS